jgi:ankyrin repeat protein
MTTLGAAPLCPKGHLRWGALDFDDIDRALDLAIGNDHFAIVKYLIEYDPTLSVELTVSGFTSAAYYGKLHILKYLIGKGANIHVDNDLAFLESIERGHLDVVTYLIETYGMPVTNENILGFAARSGKLAVVEYLISKGAEPL